jgi:hypothetical protein
MRVRVGIRVGVEVGFKRGEIWKKDDALQLRRRRRRG